MRVAPLLRSSVTNVATLDTPVSVRLLGVSAAAGAESMKTMLACRGAPGACGAAAAAADASGSASARGALWSTSRPPCACHPWARALGLGSVSCHAPVTRSRARPAPLRCQPRATGEILLRK
jgi:hypothetical protein